MSDGWVLYVVVVMQKWTEVGQCQYAQGDVGVCQMQRVCSRVTCKQVERCLCKMGRTGTVVLDGEAWQSRHDMCAVRRTAAYQ